ncbi:hypothetical protein KQI63_05780 [bacterium]|nr:hypothetical protein [bacterium]
MGEWDFLRKQPTRQVSAGSGQRSEWAKLVNGDRDQRLVMPTDSVADRMLASFEQEDSSLILKPTTAEVASVTFDPEEETIRQLLRNKGKQYQDLQDFAIDAILNREGTADLVPPGVTRDDLLNSLNLSSKAKLAGYTGLKTLERLPIGAVGFGRKAANYNPLAAPAILKGATGLKVPGYERYAEEHPLDASLLELPGTFIPFGYATRALGKAGFTANGSRFQKALVRGLRDAITIGGVEGGAALVGGEGFEEAIKRGASAAPYGLSYGFIGGLTEQLKAAVRITSQAAGGMATHAITTGDTSPSGLITGAAMPAVFEMIGAVPELGRSVRYHRDKWAFLRRMKKGVRESFAKPATDFAADSGLRKSGEIVTPEGTTYRGPDREAARQQLAVTLEEVGLPKAQATSLSRGDVSPEVAVRSSLPADMDPGQYSLAFEKRVEAVRQRMTVAADRPEQLVLFHSGIRPQDVIKFRDIDPNLPKAWDDFLAGVDRAIADGTPENIDLAVKGLLKRRTDFIERGLKGNFNRLLGRRHERMSVDMPAPLARMAADEVRLRMAEIELGKRLIVQQTKEIMGELWNAPLADQLKLRDLVKGVKGVDDEGNFLFATLAEADAVPVKLDKRNGLEYIETYPVGRGGQPVRHYIAGDEITYTEAGRSPNMGTTIPEVDGIPITKPGKSIDHNDEVLVIGDRHKRVREPKALKSVVTLVEDGIPQVQNPETGRMKQVRKPKTVRISARFNDELGVEEVSFLKDPKQEAFDLIGAKPGRTRVKHEGVDYIFEGEDHTTPGAAVAILRHPGQGRELRLPIDDGGTIVVSPGRRAPTDAVPVDRLYKDLRLYHNGIPYRVRSVKQPQPKEGNDLIEWGDQLRLYRRINTNQTRQLLEDLTNRYPNVPDVIKAYRAQTEELYRTAFGRALTPFSSEVLRQMYDVETSRLPEAAYWPSVAKEEGPVHFLARSAGESLHMGPRVAPGRKFKSGRLGTEGREIEHFGIASAVRRTEFMAEGIQQELEAKMLALTGRPIGPEGLLPGFVKLGRTSFGGDPDQLVKTLQRYPGIAKAWGVTNGDITIARKMMDVIQVPGQIGEMVNLRGRTRTEPVDPATRTVLKGLGEITRNLTNYWVANQLTRPSTAVRNWLSGEILYFNKTLIDFYEGVLDKWVFQENPLPFAQLRNDLHAYAGAMTKDARGMIPEELLGGRFYDDFIKGNAWQSDLTPSKNLVRQALVPFREVEVMQKRRSFLADLKTDAERAAWQLEQSPQFEGWGRGGKDAFIRQYMQAIPEQTFNRARDNIRDVAGFDYGDKPYIMEKLTQAGGRAVVPYPNYIYHYLRMIGSGVKDAAMLPKMAMQTARRVRMGNMDPAWKLHDETMNPRNLELGTAPNTTELKRRMARGMAATTMIGLSLAFLKTWERGRDAIAGVELPWEAQTGGRVKMPDGMPIVGSHGDTESWVRLYDQPWLGEVMFMWDAWSGKRFLSDYLNDRVSTGFALNGVLTAMGYRDEFDLYSTGGARAAEIASGFIPFGGAANTFRRLVDPVKRDPEGAYTNDLKGFGLNLVNKAPFASKLLPPRFEQGTDEVAMYNRRIEFLKLFLLNFKEVSKENREELSRDALQNAIDRATQAALEAERRGWAGREKEAREAAGRGKRALEKGEYR